MLLRTAVPARAELGRLARQLPERRRGDYSVRTKPKRLNKRIPLVTICIAAICDEGRSAIAISDRMYTTFSGSHGELQYEPAQTKGIALHNRIAMLFAGDASVHDQLWWEVEAEKVRLGVDSPEITVKWFADTYAKHYQLLRAKCIESEILSPFGLTAKSFLSEQQRMNPAFVGSITKKILNHAHFDLDLIVVGLDESRGKGEIGLIYTVREGKVNSENTAGFVAIGCGAPQAESELQLAGYTRSISYSRAMLLIYCAKKRAELVPGVGKETDIYSMRYDKSAGVIYHGGGNGLEAVYQKFNTKRLAALTEGEADMAEFIKGNHWL